MLQKIIANLLQVISNTCNIILLYLINNVGKWKVCHFLKSHQEQEVDTSFWNIIIRYLLSISQQMKTTSVIKIDRVQKGISKNGRNLYFLKYEVWLLNNNTSHAAVTLIPLFKNRVHGCYSWIFPQFYAEMCFSMFTWSCVVLCEEVHVRDKK